MGIFAKNLCRKSPNLEAIYRSSADVIILCVDPRHEDSARNAAQWLKSLERCKTKPDKKVGVVMTKLDDVSSFFQKISSFSAVTQKGEAIPDAPALFTRLPPAVLHRIFLDLPLATVRDCMALDSHFYTVINENEFWHKLWEEHFPSEILDEDSNFKDKFRENLFSLQYPNLLAVKEWAKEKNIAYFETSAKINKGIDSLFDELLQPMVEKRISESPMMLSPKFSEASPEQEEPKIAESESTEIIAAIAEVEESIMKVKTEKSPKPPPENKKRNAAVFECPATVLHRNLLKKQIVSSGLLLIVGNWLYIQQNPPPYKQILAIDIRNIDKIAQASEEEITKKTGLVIPPAVHNSFCSSGLIILRKSKQTPQVLFVPPESVPGLIVEIANQLV
eukprot:Phypoly_transcript_06507.p1 GENE.Phypoly_transcript_06507~~Phypoly_transcript_06507.p1  ORF type:complete len:458 (+),score=72.26 Phypoly_transcript_06507:204-1376(+)